MRKFADSARQIYNTKISIGWPHNIIYLQHKYNTKILVRRTHNQRQIMTSKKNRPVLELEKYEDQKQRWPAEGQHILAQYTEDAVLVYE